MEIYLGIIELVGLFIKFIVLLGTTQLETQPVNRFQKSAFWAIYFTCDETTLFHKWIVLELFYKLLWNWFMLCGCNTLRILKIVMCRIDESVPK